MPVSLVCPQIIQNVPHGVWRSACDSMHECRIHIALILALFTSIRFNCLLLALRRDSHLELGASCEDKTAIKLRTQEVAPQFS